MWWYLHGRQRSSAWASCWPICPLPAGAEGEDAGRSAVGLSCRAGDPVLAAAGSARVPGYGFCYGDLLHPGFPLHCRRSVHHCYYQRQPVHGRAGADGRFPELLHHLGGDAAVPPGSAAGLPAHPGRHGPAAYPGAGAEIGVRLCPHAHGGGTDSRGTERVRYLTGHRTSGEAVFLAVHRVPYPGCDGLPGLCGPMRGRHLLQGPDPLPPGGQPASPHRGDPHGHPQLRGPPESRSGRLYRGRAARAEKA